MLEALKQIATVAEVVVGLGLLIFVHEFGHFLMAKRNKVRVEAFALGFGQAIFRRRVGETEYRINWIPLGGYVKMAGELPTDDHRGEPWELSSQGAWSRVQIFTAGAIMNLIIAFPLAIVTFFVGRYEVSNEVGVPGMAEAAAGIRAGDVVVEVDGRMIESLDKYRIDMVQRSAGEKVPVKVRRDGKEVTLTVAVMGSSYLAAMRPPSVFLGDISPGSPAAAAGLQAEDEVIAVDGRRIFSGRQLDEALRKGFGRSVRLTARRRDESWKETIFEAGLTPSSHEVYVFPDSYEVVPCVVRAALPGQPAAGKLESGDVIRRVDGREIRSWQDVMDVVEPSVGKPLRFEIARDSKVVEIAPTYGESGQGVIGIIWTPSKVFAQVSEGSFYYKAGLRSGDELYSLDGAAGDKVTTDKLVGARSLVSGSRVVVVRRGGETKELLIEPEKRVEGDLAALGFKTAHAGMIETGYSMPFRRRAWADALRAGIREPYDIWVMTVEVLKKLVMGEESPKGLSGPVGIFTVTYRSAELSLGNFLWLLCLITVNLGVFNLLPIPILDGGHMVLLLIEKVRGRPPSEKFQAAFQYTGLIFILSLILFVTFNDITR